MAGDLKLLGGRFAISATWENQHVTPPTTGTGTPIPYSDSAGQLWFFDIGSPEIMIKMIDGTALNKMYWFFYGSLTDVAYVLTVRDTVSGAVKTYPVAAGQTCIGAADTSAFPVTLDPGPCGCYSMVWTQPAAVKKVAPFQYQGQTYDTIIDVKSLPPFWQCVYAVNRPGATYGPVTEFLKPDSFFREGYEGTVGGCPDNGYAIHPCANKYLKNPTGPGCQKDADGNCLPDPAYCPNGFKTVYP